MVNSEPFTGTGVLGTAIGGNITAYGGWTLGWDNGFNNSIDDGNVWLGGASASFPVYSQPGWAIRYQGNAFLQGMTNPLQNNRTDELLGLSGTLYAQSISGNALGVGGGWVTSDNRFDATWVDFDMFFNVGDGALLTNVAFGNFDFAFGNQKRGFWSTHGELRHYWHDDRFMTSLFYDYGEINDLNRSFSQIGGRVAFQLPGFEAATIFAKAKHTRQMFDSPFINNISYNFIGAGLTLNFNNIETGIGRPLTLRERDTFSTPFELAPIYLRIMN